MCEVGFLETDDEMEICMQESHQGSFQGVTLLGQRGCRMGSKW